MQRAGHPTNPTLQFRADVSCTVQEDMRLRELHDELVLLRATLRLTRRAESGGALLESSPQAIRDALVRIRELPVGAPIAELATQALKGPLSGWQPRAMVAPGDASAVDTQLAGVANLIDNLLSALASVLHDPPQLAIQLPPGDSVSDLAQALSWIDDGLVKPTREWVGASVAVVGVDRGSAWIELVVREFATSATIAASALKPLGLAGMAYKFLKLLLTEVPKLVDKAAEWDAKFEELRHTRAMNQHEEQLAKANDELRTTARRTLAEQLAEVALGPNANTPADPEAVGRLQRAIELLERLFKSGAKADTKRLPSGDNATAAVTEAKPAAPAQLPSGEKK